MYLLFFFFDKVLSISSYLGLPTFLVMGVFLKALRLFLFPGPHDRWTHIASPGRVAELFGFVFHSPLLPGSPTCASVRQPAERWSRARPTDRRSRRRGMTCYINHPKGLFLSCLCFEIKVEKIRTAKQKRYSF